MIYDDVVDHRDTEDGISPMMAAVGAGRLEVVRHLVNQHSDEYMVGMARMMMRWWDSQTPGKSAFRWEFGLDGEDGYGDGGDSDEDDEKVNEDYPEGEMVSHLVN